MSGRGTKAGVARAAIGSVCLLLLLAVQRIAHDIAPSVHGPFTMLAALGLLLLAGTLGSELAGIIRLPHLTGYIAAGILVGPHVLHLIDHEAVSRLAPVDTLALSMIALAGGAELEAAALKRGLRVLLSAMVSQTLLGLVLMGLVFFGVRGFISSTRDLSTAAAVGASLLWGVFAIARSPSAALGVISQTRADGPLARFTVAFVMGSDVVVVVALAAAVTVARPLITPGASFSLEAFHALGHELLGSVAIGTTLGLILALYLRFTRGQLLIVLVALGFGASEVLRYLHYDPMLSFIVAGFVVRNLSQQGPKLLHAIEQTGEVVYVVFFACAGAHLDIPLLKSLWPIALLLAGMRVAVTVLSSIVSNRFSGDTSAVRRWGWAPLVSQAGFAIGIARLANREFPELGQAFSDLAIATVALNELAGPMLFKFSLERAKEARDPVLGLNEAEEAART